MSSSPSSSTAASGLAGAGDRPLPGPPSPELVCFDLGGVIVRICRSWEEGCRRAGVAPVADMDRIVADPAWHRLNARYQAGAIAFDDFVTALQELAAGRQSAADIRRVHEAWILGEYEGAAALLRDLAAQGVATAMLSNTCLRHLEIMRDYPALQAFGRVFASPRIGLVKPDRAIYEHVATETGATPGGILFFDDTPANVEAARAAGWRAHLVDPAGDPPAQVRSVLAEARVLR